MLLTHTCSQPRGPQWGAGWYSLPSEEGRQQAETVPNGYGYALQGAVAAGPEHECTSAHCRAARAQSVHREGTVDFARTILLNNCEHPGAAFAVLCGFTKAAQKNASEIFWGLTRQPEVVAHAVEGQSGGPGECRKGTTLCFAANIGRLGDSAGPGAWTAGPSGCSRGHTRRRRGAHGSSSEVIR